MGRPNRAASGALGRAPLPVPVRLEPAGPGWGWVTGTRGHRWPWSRPVRTSRALGGKPQGIWGPDCPLAGNVTKWRAWGGIWGDIWGRGVLPQHEVAHLSAFSWSTVVDGNPGLRFSLGGGRGTALPRPTPARDARGPPIGTATEAAPSAPQPTLLHPLQRARQASLFNRGVIRSHTIPPCKTSGVAS